MSDQHNYSQHDKSKFSEAHADVLLKLREEIDGTVRLAHGSLGAALVNSINGRIPAPVEGYYWATVLQHAFCRLSGADPETLEAGDVEVAEASLENLKNISAMWTNRS